MYLLIDKVKVWPNFIKENKYFMKKKKTFNFQSHFYKKIAISRTISECNIEN